MKCSGSSPCRPPYVVVLSTHSSFSGLDIYTHVIEGKKTKRARVFIKGKKLEGQGSLVFGYCPHDHTVKTRYLAVK